MELLLLKNMLWPALLTAATISFLDYIIDRKKSSLYLGLFFLVVGIITAAFIIVNNNEYLFLQLYLFMFFLSISLVILALRKRIDSFTIIGILLMIVMLILLLRFTIDII